MDLFFSTSSLKKKKRVHFHSFISSIHATLHSIKQEQLKKDGRSFHVDLSEENDPIKKVANKISEECDLLCFDEFQITDIADALILRNLLFNLFNSNTVVVATSNRPIRDLYKGGINYEYFEPTLGMIERFCREVEVGEEGLDFRREKAEESEGRSFKVGGEVGEIVEGWVGEWEGKEVEIEIEFGRVLKADKADLGKRIGEFEFDELCDRYYGSSEYRAIGMNFDVVILKNVKRMTLKNHNQSRRFITLIDELYEGKCKLICNAEVEIDELFGVDEIEDDWIGDDDVSPYTKGVTSGTVKPLPGWMDVRQSGGKMLGELASVRELRFAFKRAGSRLKEMTSSLWWEE
ncbi:hypothetical protein TL16_g08406 [Triparma laevis f. inornata]|uniref:AFG1-like ATPase n=2 Tax=Triparma laevis TaxID=1534972 RepID=A0A9W7F351_9STRA|nr:hypothetical protein TL16_g08406 [Triparma laevis f. inornata]GMI01434.1 hypothetical protein TrLO_g4915 [Triparma laevis f. longispina]